MKKLTRLLLIHWHYFIHETISFEMLNFLTGKNASGKSTIIDAIQLVLLGDTSGHYFNKAASGKGNRSLLGYLKGELGDDEESGFKYLRNGRFNSYIVLEFFDEKKNKYFTGGCCFEVYSENDIQKLFFLYDGEFPQNEFIEEKLPWDIRKLREFLKEKYPGHKTTDIGREFRTVLYGRMGGLRDRFGSLLKKAVSFNPNVDIQDFISEFVCDTQQTIDVSQMQENIRSYKRLEEEATILQTKLESLEQIRAEHTAYLRAKQAEQLYAYLIDQAQKDIKLLELKEEQQKVAELLDELQEVELILISQNKRISQLQEERDQLKVRLLNDETAQAMQLLESEIAEEKARIKSIIANYEKAISRLSQYLFNWNRCAVGMLDKLNSLEENSFEGLLYSLSIDLGEESTSFLQQLVGLLPIKEQSVLSMGENGLQELSDLANSLKTHAIELGSHLSYEQKKLTEQRNALQQEQKSLESGIYEFPQEVLDLKVAIASRLRTIAKQEVKVLIVAEAAEIENDRWRNVIEGYLHTQKYYIIVPDEYFKEALRVFNTMKRTHKLYSTGLVDIEKLRLKNPTLESGSLAEEIQTDDSEVRVFLDYILGQVYKCENVNQLRNFRTAITDEGMLYKGHVVRAMDPKRWDTPAIGQGAILRRLEAVKEQLKVITQQITACITAKAGINLCRQLDLPSENDIQQAVICTKEKQNVPALEQNLQRLRASLEAIDKSSIEALKDHLEQLDNHISGLIAESERHKDHRSTWVERLRRCKEETIPQIEAEIKKLQQIITNRYDPEWIESTGRLSYQDEISKRVSAKEIANLFPRRLTRSTNLKNAAWSNLVGLRQDYNRKYIMGYDPNATTNEAYNEAWLKLSENELPEYLTRIKDTREKAFEQFQEDFLSRLENNIRDADTQIKGLNSAIKGSYFGEETFRFKISPRPEYKRYYDMLVDPMKTEGGYTLFSEQFNLKYKEEIDELFALITNEDNNGKALGLGDYDKRVQMFTDFRTYLTFDLESVNREGESQRLSKTMGKKSGGETQTPFYIAVLASFAQLYRTIGNKTENTVRLLIFDEAFSKMDGERIVRSVQLLRHFNFQVILSAPTEKVGDIGTLVDRNLCVLREGKRTCVKAFDPRRSEWQENE